MLLSRVVEVSDRVAQTAKRLEKIDLIRTLLRQATPEEVEIVVAFLSGSTRQGRVGIGYALLREVSSTPAAETASLDIRDVEHTLEEFGTIQGRGSAAAKRDVLRGLFARAIPTEQRFLIGLLSGELRQGALEGIMLDAIAKAAGIWPC